ncbi:hypothetical protein DIPPA_06025 [Diplonema papillatum]|nr:hypothetical protein DIPPA_06025 [Diplonema papillatum]
MPSGGTSKPVFKRTLILLKKTQRVRRQQSIRSYVIVGKHKKKIPMLNARERRAMGAAVALWALSSMFLHLQLFLEEVIGGHTMIEVYFNGDHYVTCMILWHVLGVSSWYWLMYYSLSHLWAERRQDQEFLMVDSLGCWYAFYIIVALFVIGFLEPNNQWRQVHRARVNLSTGGEGHRGCFVSPNADALRVLENETYITLVDDGWQVDFNARSSVASHDWTYLAAPIVYKGPQPNCKFDPPIVAYCILKTKDVSAENCFFKPAGAYTTMRKAKRAEYLEDWLLNKVPAGHDRIFEFNSFPRKDLAEYISSMEGIRDRQYNCVLIVWYVLSSACLCYLFILILQSREPERPVFDEISGDFVVQWGGSDGKMQDYGDYGEMRDYGNDQV